MGQMKTLTINGRTFTVVSPTPVASVTLPSSAWIGDTSPYSQVVPVAGATENSQVNLTPTVEQNAIFSEKNITFTTKNEGGIVTIYVFGQKPTNDYTIPADLMEVENAGPVIYGITIATHLNPEKLPGGTVSDEQIEKAVNKYLEEHPAAGQPGADGKDGKDGADGYSPTAKVTQTATGATVTITDKNGTTTVTITNGKDGKDGANGNDYVLTEADKAEIAEQAAELVDVPEGGNVELDTTLTASGKAADAKAVGDALDGKLSTSGGTMSGKIVFPTGDQNVGFANSHDMKIFGYGAVNGEMHMRMGDTTYPFQIRGKGDRPKYNDGELVMMADLNAIMGSYITDIDNLVGGEG
jgi:hypothetical protein